MKKILYLFSASLLILGGCKKDDATTSTTENYLPNSVGSNWTYKITTAGSTQSTVKYTVSSRDTSAVGKSYTVITGNNGTNQYYTRIGSDYYNFRTLSGQGLELLFLKDNLAVNGAWNTSQTINGLTGLPGGITSANVLINYVIKEKGTTRTVSGTTYNNIIKVEATLSAGVSLLTLPLGTAEFYFSKGVGIVESKVLISNTTLGFNIDEKYELQSYEIK
ncbi:MAG: hypothetical protein MUE72_06825 [Chitinophagaceae bacterium]|jgi:hypothetical protein|nr:hypothetical protein [Chitinophagaceae bacterium]